MSDGQLTLFDDDGDEIKDFKPINNVLRIGSDLKADVILSGLKNLAFEIAIDGFGRVSITNFMKKLKVNEKRMAKNFSRPLINNSTIQILNYKFCWKYNPKFTKSYSMSPCSKPNQNIEKDFIGKRRKTVVCFNRHQFEDEDEGAIAVAHKEPDALIEDENEENTTIVSTLNKPTDDPVSSERRTPFKPIIKLQALSDPVMDDAKASNGYETPMRNIIDSEAQSTSKRRTSLLLPVRENRATELRRASIRKSMSGNEYPVSSNSFTPNRKPNPSAAMVKGINAIVRVGLDDDDGIRKKSPIKNRNVLDTTNLQKFIKTPNKSLSQIIDKMDMFNVVTDEMKKVGPSAYVSSVRKLGAVNSPRRTPKKCVSTPKRQSLHSELVELGICPIPAEEPISKGEEEDITPSANLPSNELEEKLQLSSDESDDDDEPMPEECLSSSNDDSIISVDDDSECQIVTSEDEVNSADATDDTSEDILVTNTSRGLTESSQSSGASIQTISDSERCSQISSDQLGCKGDTEDELDDSVFAKGNETFVQLLAEDTPTPKSNIQPSERCELIFSTDEETAENIKTPVTDNQTEQQSEICDDKYSTNAEVNNDTETVAVSTPSTRRPSLIRTRRNSRLCSLDECCNSTPYESPRKTKSEKKVQPSPRSILKTPNSSKTPKRNVRIMEPILHEEDDEEAKISAENVSQTCNALDETFEIDKDESVIESSFVVAEMQLSHPNKTPEKHQSTLLVENQSNSSVLNKEIISSGVQNTYSLSNGGEDNRQKSVQLISSPEPSDHQVTKDIEHRENKLHSNSNNDEGDEFVEPINLPEPNNGGILSEIEQEAELKVSSGEIEGETLSKVSSGEIEGETFETRLSSPEPNVETLSKVSAGELEEETFATRINSTEPSDQKEPLIAGETCQDIIIPSETNEYREPHLDCNSSENCTDLEELLISPEPNKKIVSSNLNETNSHSNGGEENDEKSVELTNSPQPSKEINDDGKDEKEQSSQQPNLSESSNEIILSETEKEPQLYASIGFEERPNSSDTNEDVECQINQSYSISGKDKEPEPESQSDAGKLEELDEEESVNLPNLSNEAILLEVKQDPESDMFEEQFTSAPSDKEEPLIAGETCQDIIIPSETNEYREPHLDCNSSENCTDLEELLISPEPNKKIVSSNLNETNSHSNGGEENDEKSVELTNSPQPSKEINDDGKDEKEQSSQQPNLSESSNEIILSETEKEPQLYASIGLEERPNSSDTNEDVECQINQSYSISDKDKEPEPEPQSDAGKLEELDEEESVNLPNLSNEAILLEVKQDPVLQVMSGEGDSDMFEEQFTSAPSDNEEPLNSTETCEQIIIPSEIEDRAPQSDSNTRVNGTDKEQSILAEPNQEIISPYVQKSHSHCNDEKKSTEERSNEPEPSTEITVSEIQQEPPLGASVELGERLNLSEKSEDIENQRNKSYDKSGKDGETEFEERQSDESEGSVNLPLLSNETVLAESKQETQSNVDICDNEGERIEKLLTSPKANDQEKRLNSTETCQQIIIPSETSEHRDLQLNSNTGIIDGKSETEIISLDLIETNSSSNEVLDDGGESNERNSSPVSRNDTHMPSFNEPSMEVESNPTHFGQLKLDFEFKSRKTILNKINSVLGSYGLGSLYWSENNAHQDASKDDTKPNETQINEKNDTALAIVPTQDIRESLTSVTNDSETPAVTEIQSQHDSESTATSNSATTTTKDLKQPKSIETESEKSSESHANNIDESLNVPTRRGRKIETKVPDDLKSSKKEVPNLKATSDDESEAKKSSTDESEMVFKMPASDMIHPTRQGRTNKAKADSDTLKLGTPEKISRSTVNETSVQRDRKRKISESEEPDTDESHMASETPETSENDVNIPTRGRNNKAKPKTGDDSKNVEVSAVGKVSRATVNRGNVQGSRKRKTTRIEESKANQSDTDDDVNIPTRGRNNKAKPMTGDDSKNVEVAAVGKASRATANKAKVQGSRTRKITGIEDSEANQSDTDDDVNIPTRGRNNKAKPMTGDDSKNVEVAEVGKASRATVNKAKVQGSRTRKITGIEDSEANQSDTDDDVNIPTRGRNNRAKPKTGDDSKNVEVAEVGKASRATVNKAKVQGSRTRKITGIEDSEANQSDTDDDVNIPTRGRNNKAKPKTGDDSKNVEVAEVGKASRATVNKAKVQGSRTRKITGIEDSEANQSDTDDDVNIPTRGRNNRAKPKTGDDSKNVEVAEVGKASRATANKAKVQGSRTRKITGIEDSEANQSDTDDDVNIPTRGRNNKAKPMTGDDSKNVEVAEVGKASRATVNKAKVQGSRTRKITGIEDSEANQSDTDDDVNIPTRGRNNRAKPKTGDDSKDLKLVVVKSEKDSSAGATKMVQKGRKRKITTIEDFEAVQSDTDKSQVTSEVSAPNNNDKSISTRGRNNKAKAKADDDSKTVESGAVENVRKRRNRQATVAENVEVPASTTYESQLDHSEAPATSEDDKNIQKRKGGKNKADASDDSKTSKVDAVENFSEIPTVKKATRGRKRKTNANDNTEETTSIEDIHVSSESRTGRCIKKKSEKNSEASSSTKVDQVKVPSLIQQSTTDDLEKTNEKTKPESAKATSQLSTAVTRKGRKVAEVDSEADIPSSKDSLSSKPVLRKGRKMTEVNSEIDGDDVLPVPITRGRRGNSNTGMNVADESEEPKRQKLMNSSKQTEFLDVPLAKRLRSNSVEPKTTTETVQSKANTRPKRGGK